MLASSSSVLIAAAPLSAGAKGGDAAPAGGDTAPGFAALLEGLSAQAPETAPSDGQLPGPANAASVTASASGLAIAAALTKPATAGQAAAAGGKVLPDDLPETDEAPGGAGAAAEISAVAAPAGDALVLPAVAGALPAPVPAVQGGGQPGPAARRSRGPAAAEFAGAAQAAVVKPGAEPAASGGRQPLAVAVSVAPLAGQPSDAAEPAAGEPASRLRAPAAPASDLPRGEAPLTPLAPAPVTADARNPGPAGGPPPASTVPTPAPAAAEIDAALDQLVAAREALMPAEASLAIDHAEFGEVSIRFEQARDGRLSAELAAADPELRRAVTAAVSAERGAATGSEGDGARPAQPGGQRAASAGSDAAPGERGSSGHERDRRGASRPEPGQAPSDPRPGIFA
jgi:hypothetical protein